ncbi:MAG TPA: KEOPS complex subunit Pcc1 [Candidatus Saccharimonadales bacterium]|nr:KEOPS complex subunit Pcc1 [Candidatus Saccharimonadales bacterium]
MTKTSAKIVITLRSSRELASIVNSITPELNNPLGNRAHASAKTHHRTLQLNFEAEDPHALHAIVTSLLRITKASLDACDTIITLKNKHRTEKQLDFRKVKRR